MAMYKYKTSTIPNALRILAVIMMAVGLILAVYGLSAGRYSLSLWGGGMLAVSLVLLMIGVYTDPNVERPPLFASVRRRSPTIV